VATGTQTDDRAAPHRPGLREAGEFGVVEPLASQASTRPWCGRWRRAGTCGAADKPAAPCLASRIQAGVAVSVPLLGVVERAEQQVRDFLAGPGIAVSDLRVRILRDAFRVELDPSAHAAVRAEPELPELLLGALRSINATLAGPGLLTAHRTGSVGHVP
jgi:uncharacterized protein